MNTDTLLKLRSLPKPSYHKQTWPPGKRQPLTREVAERFFELLSTCDTSLMDLLANNPDLPPFKQLDSWRRSKAWFNQQWTEASQNRAHFLAESCAKLANEATAKTAHVTRVKFDIFKWLCAKFYPAQYGDKPIQLPNSTTVNVGISISPERLTEIRSKLDAGRSAFLPAPSKLAAPNGSSKDSPV